MFCPYWTIEHGAAIQYLSSVYLANCMPVLKQIALVKDWSLHNDDLTEYAISRSNIVINLVGSYMETRNFSFEDIHHKWPAKLAKICAKSPLLERFVHFSDMGANANSASRRMRSKAAGDEAVREILPGATILR